MLDLRLSVLNASRPAAVCGSIAAIFQSPIIRRDWSPIKRSTSPTSYSTLLTSVHVWTARNFPSFSTNKFEPLPSSQHSHIVPNMLFLAEVKLTEPMLAMYAKCVFIFIYFVLSFAVLLTFMNEQKLCRNIHHSNFVHTGPHAAVQTCFRMAAQRCASLGRKNCLRFSFLSLRCCQYSVALFGRCMGMISVCILCFIVR